MTLNLSGTRRAALAGALLMLAAGAACGSGSSSVPAGTQPPATNPGDGATPGAAATHSGHAAEIDQRDMKFVPARVAVKIGETVLIKNSETPIHTANINGKNITGNMKKGDSTVWTASAAGEYKVSCDYHPQMSATISVS